MSTAESKLNLLQMIMESNDKNFIDRLSNIARSLKKTKSEDWADELPSHVMEELKLSIDEAENGDIPISNSQMLEAARKDFPNLDL